MTVEIQKFITEYLVNNKGASHRNARKAAEKKFGVKLVAENQPATSPKPIPPQSSMKIEKRNAYICEKCMGLTLIVHIDEGTTPMFLRCRKEGCDGQATSFMYRLPPVLALPQPGKFPASHEWYMPATTEGLTEGEKEHVKNGGVLLRPRTDAAPFMVEVKYSK